MREYFRDWRQKMGWGTLVVAGIFTAGWVESYIVDGVVEIAGARLTSTAGSLQVVYLLPTIRSTDYVSHLLSWTIPYWSIVGPLTLLSVYLLRWKPQIVPSHNCERFPL